MIESKKYEQGYQTHIDHIKDELFLLDLKLDLASINLQNLSSSNNDFRGIFISDEQVEDLLHQPKERTSNNTENKNILLNKILEYRKKIDKRKKIAYNNEKKTILPIDQIVEKFNLSAFEYEVLIICLAQEIDAKYEIIFSYIHNDITKKKATMDLCFKILDPLFPEKGFNRQYFNTDSVLFKYRIIEFSEIQQNVLSRPLKLNEYIINYVIHNNILKLQNISKNFFITKPLESNLDIPSYIYTQTKLYKYIFHKLENKQNYYNNLSKTILAYLHGRDKSGKREVIRSLSGKLDQYLIEIPVENTKEPNYFNELLTQVIQTAKLSDAILYFENIDSIMNVEDSNTCNNSNFEIFLDKIYDFDGIVFIDGEKPWNFEVDLKELEFLNITFPNLSHQEREIIWNKLLYTNHIKGIDIHELASKFNFTPIQISNAITNSITTSQYNGNTKIELNDLYDACYNESNKNLTKFSNRIYHNFRLNDLVLPTKNKQQLEAIINFVKYRNIVFDKWGFQSKFNLSTGLNILFFGEPGTGKTMAAEIIANELNLEIYKIDLSLVISKYIGETEKHINQIFKEAETSNAVLFFDEADAIFGKRSEIKDSHDRYSNIETSYLLQKIEEHKEIVILASNFKRNIDEAFIRRMHFVVEFPFPDEQNRLSIWKNIFPKSNIDSKNSNSNAEHDQEVGFPIKIEITEKQYNFLAQNFIISGSMIRNIALSSAFLAASTSSDSIKIEHVILATKQELEKNGKPILKTSFGEYFHYIKDNN